MSAPMRYTINEILRLTNEEIQGIGEEFRIHAINACANYGKVVPSESDPSSKLTERFVFNRELVRKRSQIPCAKAVDAIQLEAKLRQLPSTPTHTSSSPTSSVPTPAFDHEAQLEEDLREERKAYKSLLNEGGIPSYPLHVIHDVLTQRPGRYTEIVSYWSSHPGRGEDVLFRQQLEDWRTFRRYQQKVRHHFTHCRDFPRYQQSVRDRLQRHGIEDDVSLFEDQGQQNRLQDWIEYQDSKIQTLENLQKRLGEARQEQASSQTALVEKDLPEVEGTIEEGIVNLSSAFRFSDEEEKARRKVTDEQESVILAEGRLKTVQADNFGDTIHRLTWEQHFLKEADAARLRSTQVPNFSVRPKDWHVQGRLHCPDREDVEEWDQWWEVEEQRRKAERERHNAEYNAREDVRLAEAALRAAELDSFGEMIGRGALVQALLKDLALAHARLDDAKASLEKTRLRGKALGSIRLVAELTSQLERHQILMRWIEKRRREVVSELANPTVATNDGRSLDGTRSQPSRASEGHRDCSTQEDCIEKGASVAPIDQHQSTPPIFKQASKKGGPFSSAADPFTKDLQVEYKTTPSLTAG
ncbi:MAG: hypothetical protein Q9165_007978 [Trypethelium subeluteriae]